jgi:hypothetical protein
MADMAREWYPEIKDRIVHGNPGQYTYQNPGVFTLIKDKSKRDLGITCECSVRVAAMLTSKIDLRPKPSRTRWTGCCNSRRAV